MPLKHTQHNSHHANEPSRLSALFDQHKFNEALGLARKLMKQFPDEPAYYLAVFGCELQMKKFRQAHKVLLKAETRFPRHSEILHQLGLINYILEDFEEAERYDRKALDALPADNKLERSMYYNDLGEALWKQHKGDDALEAWRSSLEANPENDTAQQHLDECVNEYAEPKAPNKLFDDIYHFTNIHKEQYFAQQGISDFDSAAEMQQVVGAIQHAWNEYIAPRGDETDAMTAAEKTALFRSVSVDFTQSFTTPLKTWKPPLPEELLPLTDDEWEMMREFDEAFPYLPLSSGVLLPFAAPALLAAGFREPRIEAIISGATPTEEEEEILLWAIDMTSVILEALECQGTPEEIAILKEAIDIAEEVLLPQVATLVVGHVRKTLELGFTLPPDTKQKRKRKR
jgi:tetratricopeptide (TPR) repeat protein